MYREQYGECANWLWLTWILFVTIYGSLGITITWLTSVRIWLVKTKRSRLTLVACLTNHQWLTSTVSRLLFTLTWPSHSSFSVTNTLCTPLWIALWQIVESLFALVTVFAFHIELTGTFTSSFVTLIQKRWWCTSNRAVAWWTTIWCKAVETIFTLITFAPNHSSFARALPCNWVTSVFIPSCCSKRITVTRLTA